MATFKLPTRNGFRQLGQGDVYGELWSTKNVDLHANPGKIKLARPFTQVVTAATLGDEAVEAFAIYEGEAYALTEDALFKSDAPYTTWTEDTSSPTTAQDLENFDGYLVVSSSTNMHTYDGTTYDQNWWTETGGTALTSGVPHVLHSDSRIRRIFVTDGNMVRAYLGAVAGGGTFTTVTLPAQFVASCVKTAIRKTWIGTYTEEDKQAYVFEWDAGSTDATDSFPVGAKAVLSMELVDNAPLIVTELGEIKLFNGAGFSTIAQFPFAFTPSFVNGVETGLIQDTNTARPVHPKGMKRQGNTVYIYVNFRDHANDVPVDERTPAGVWALDLTTRSLTHLGSQENESIFVISSPLMVISDPNTRIFIGGRRNKSADEEGIWIEDLDADSENYGYFVTTEMEADSVSDMFDAAYVKALLDTDDEIVLKYRTARVIDYPLVVEDVTWASSTQFNTTSDLTAVKARFDANAKNRDEVEILLGSGAGRLAHITSITKSASTYSVVIDEEIGTAGQTCDVRFDNWRKVPATYTSTDGELKQLGIGAPGTWCQVKVEIRGKNGLPEVRQLMVHSNNKQSV